MFLKRPPAADTSACARAQGGVIDLTGELMRYAVSRATERDVEGVRRCAELVDSLQGQLIQFEFRNGALRKKYDSIKYNMKKLETVLYELSLVNAGKITAPSGELDKEPPAAAADDQ